MKAGRRRVLFIGPLPEPVTGQSLACQVFLDALRTQCDVDVVNLSKSGFRQGMDSISRVREVLKIIRLVHARQAAADVIYFTISESRIGNAKDLLIYAVCFTKLDKFVVHLHGGAGLRLLMRGPQGFQKWLNRFFLRRIGAVIVLGNRHLDVFVGAVPPDRLHVVPNFAQDELFTNRQAIERKFAQPRPLRVLFLSNLLPGKGHEELLQAFAALPPDAREGLHIDFAGGFESDNAKQAFLTRAGQYPQVQYHGTVRGDEKRELLAAAHVFCLPTYYAYEGQPISILEAYASGCAVVTTDHSGVFDIFTEGVNGLAVEKRSVESLGRVLASIVHDSAALMGMALHNLEDARAKYTIAQYNQGLLGLVVETRPCSSMSSASAPGI